MKSVVFIISAVFCLFMLISSCQRAPLLSSAANPQEALAVAPMGSATTNSLLKKKLNILNQIFDKNNVAKNTKTQDSLKEELISSLGIDLTKLAQRGIHQDFIYAQFYFNERRFIESAQILSRILDQNPVFPYARNLLARSFYFLGNSDRSLEELEYILLNQSNEPEEFLDALFLTGMITDESGTINRIKLQKAIKFLLSYLKAAPKSQHSDKARSSLKSLEQKLAKKSS